MNTPEKLYKNKSLNLLDVFIKDLKRNEERGAVFLKELDRDINAFRKNTVRLGNCLEDTE